MRGCSSKFIMRSHGGFSDGTELTISIEKYGQLGFPVSQFHEDKKLDNRQGLEGAELWKLPHNLSLSPPFGKMGDFGFASCDDMIASDMQHSLSHLSQTNFLLTLHSGRRNCQEK
jgi:hypothetical protein